MSSRTAPKTIILKGSGIAKEGIAVDSITPGMLLEISASGVATHNSSSAARGAFRVAREMEIVGGSIDDVYEAGDTVCYSVMQPGSEVYALLAAGQSVAIGDQLMSNAAGALTAQTSTNPTFAIALEAVDNDPGTGGLPVRIKVEVV
jgi:hypothetical protein